MSCKCTKRAVIEQLTEALQAAKDRLDFCGYSVSWDPDHVEGQPKGKIVAALEASKKIIGDQ